MPALQLEESIDINTDIASTRDAIENFNHWPHWSPWLCAEPEARLTYKGEPGQPGHGYDWEGQIVGAGGMELVANEADRLKMDLTFLKPFKSTAKVEFKLQQLADDKSRVSWSMDSKLPFFMFFFTKTMQGMIANDYKRGLLLLKEYAETGSTSSAIELAGVQDSPSINYVGVSAECAFDKIGESMEVNMPRLYQHVSESGAEITGSPVSIYNKVKMDFSSCQYTNGIPIASDTADLPAGLLTDEFKAGNIEPGRAFKVIHRGKYEHLGNAWSTAYMHMKAQKLKKSKSQAPFEVYVSDPENTPASDLITEIYIPVR